MTRANRPTNARESTGCSPPGNAAVLSLLERRLATYHVSKVVKPKLSREEVARRAVRDVTDDQHRAYLEHRFNGANAQLAEEARNELVSAEERLGWSAEEARENNRDRRQRAAYEIVRKPERVEPQTKLEQVFIKVVLAVAIMSLFVAWNIVTSNTLNSGLFPSLMEFPASLSLYLMSFAAVALAFLPKIHLDRLSDEQARKAFLLKLEIVTALTGLVWAICASLIFSPTADTGMVSIDIDADATAGLGPVGAMLVFSQLAVEVGMGSLLWIFGLRLAEKGRLEVAHASPARATLTAAGDVLHLGRNAMEAFCGALRGLLGAMEEIKEAYVDEELGRIEAERFRHESLKRQAIVTALESSTQKPEPELRVVS